jgi:hypothetical protein
MAGHVEGSRALTEQVTRLVSIRSSFRNFEYPVEQVRRSGGQEVSRHTDHLQQY